METAITLRQSRFLVALERNGVIALVHKLHPEPVYVASTVWREVARNAVDGTLTDSGDALVSELTLRGLLIGDSAIDQRELAAARERAGRMLDRPTILYLMMAQACTFACTYCPIPALSKRYGENLLSFEDAVAGISLWRKHIVEYPRDDDPYLLIFYGGEPLLNQGLMERLLPYVDGEHAAGRLPQNLELMVCTNGSLMNEGLAKLFARYGVTVAVGVDGPREHNDRIRVTRDGGPTFTAITSAVRQLVDNGVRVVASVAITPANVHRLTEYPQFLRSMGVAQFGFNLMKGEALARELEGGSEVDYCRAAARGVLSGLANIAEDGGSYEYQLEKKLALVQSGAPFSVDCTCYGNQLVIQPDGQVSNCPFLRRDQGHVLSLPDAFMIGRTKTVQEWRSRLPIFSDEVLADGANEVLDGGGCAWGSFEVHGDIAARDTNNALFTKEIVHELIWQLLPGEQAGVIGRGDSTHWSPRRIGPLRVAGNGRR
jgi:sulfatase maturation enzyme AslB (radical SAM superfamily)